MPKTGMPLRILIVEDSADDAALLVRELRKSGYEPASARVDSGEAMRAALAEKPWDFILSDYMIPGFGGMQALQIAKESGFDLPFVVISGKVSEETLVEVMRAGAADFLIKGNLKRLGLVIKRELADAAARRGMRQAQIEWRSAFDSVQDAIFFHDPGFRVIRANRAYAALGGMTIQEVVGKFYWEVFPKIGGPLPGCKTDMESLASGEEEFNLPDGRAYVSRSFPIADPKGHPLYSLHVLQDVTERNRVLEALEKSERHYRKLIEGGSDAFFMVDRTGKVLYRSESGKRLTGWDDKDVLGNPVSTFVAPESLPIVRNAIADILKNPAHIARIEVHVRRNDGSQVDVEAIGRNLLGDPDVGGIVVTAHDITERKKSEQALKLFRTLIDQSSDPIEVLDPVTLKYLDVNERACQELGYTRDEILSMTAFDIDPSLDRSAPDSIGWKIETSGSAILESVHRRKDGSTFPVEISIKRVELDRSYQVANVRDITERKRAQEEIEFKNRLLTTQQETSLDAILLVDENAKILTYNQRFIELWSVSEELVKEAKDEPVLQAVVRQTANPEQFLERVRYLYEHKDEKSHEEINLNDGRTIDRNSAPVIGANGKYYGRVWYFRDITARRRAEQAVLEEKAKAQHYLDIAGAMLIAVDRNRNVSLLNRKGREILGYEENEAIGKDWIDSFIPQRERDAVKDVYTKLMAGGNGKLKYRENHVLTKDRRERLIAWHNTVLHDTDGTIVGTLSSGEDITESKQAEKNLVRLNWALRALGQSNSALVHAGSEQELFQSSCDAIAGTEGYRLAWIGLARDDATHMVEIAAVSGEVTGYVEGLKVSWDETPYGAGPTGTAIRTGTTQVANDLEKSVMFAPWLERARMHGLACSISVPLRASDAIFGALVVYGGEPGAFGPPEIRLFEELATDIGYGVASRRTLAERDHLVRDQLNNAGHLKAALISTIEAVALTVEKRDPYTAGHQRRVAELSLAIGQKLDFPEDRLEGLRLGATIHDIGKIYVPAEILNRPGKLTKPEFEIIKSHPQVGYDIVKDVKFPWPVLDMILQHHERVDGTGYPAGLKGEQIAYEARIIAVADVIEAMSSHRPYRPGLGVEKALSEIERGRGTAYDPVVVDACVKLFKETGFAFSG